MVGMLQKNRLFGVFGTGLSEEVIFEQKSAGQE